MSKKYVYNKLDYIVAIILILLAIFISQFSVGAAQAGMIPGFAAAVLNLINCFSCIGIVASIICDRFGN